MTLCLSGPSCAAYDHIGQHAAYTERPLCDDCLTRARRATSALVLDYRDLEQHLPPALGVWGDGQPHGDRSAPIPMRLGVEALQREIWWITTAWAEVLTERCRLVDPPGRGVRDGYAVAWAVRVLEPRLGVLARLGAVELVDYPWIVADETTLFRVVEMSRITGAQGVLDLVWLHDRARSVLGLTSGTRRLPGYCRNLRCGRPELYQDNGSDTVWCGHCSARMTRDDYDEYGNLFRKGAA